MTEPVAPTSTVSDDKLAESEAGYTVLFNCIGAAVTPQSATSYGISVRQFREALNKAGFEVRARRSPIEGDVGVTDEMVEAATEKYRLMANYPIVPGNHVFALRKALEAALASPRADTRGEVVARPHHRNGGRLIGVAPWRPAA